MTPVPHNHNFVIVSVKEPVIWQRDDDEHWLLNPPRRYIVNAEHVKNLDPHVESISDLKSASKYKPLNAKTCKLADSRILVERTRDRGIGDMLFLTGPLSYMCDMSSKTSKFHMYGLSERSQILHRHPCLEHKTVFSGPLHYEDLDLYDAHWFVDSVTEYDEEKDQANVYDALYRQIGVDPATVDPRYKRPSIVLDDEDDKRVDSFYYYSYMERKVDFRRTPYFVVAPLAHSSLRSMPYGLWLQIIAKLSSKGPVFVMGHYYEGRMPTMDMSFGEFYNRVTELSSKNAHIVNLLGETPIRLMCSLIQRAQGIVCLDSGPLYVAEALRTPAVSVWGTHSPSVRLGYDKPYMDSAVWSKDACAASPCFAYSNFPATKCPKGASQSVCEVLAHTSVDEVVAKIDKIKNDTKFRAA